MISSGAKYIVLAGRSLPKPDVTQTINKLKFEGSEIISIQLDVGNYEDCKQLLETLKFLGIPQLRGIMHAAGVLSDATFINQTWDKYETVFNAKVKGGWNLHKLTLDYPLEHFIMFSSAAATFAPIGLGNHCSANVYLDTLTTYRNSIGLPATTINWGQWGQVGVAADIEMTGLKPFTVLQGISALERVMKTQRLQTIVLEADFRVLKAYPSCRKYFEELKYKEKSTNVVKMTVGTKEFWAEFDSVSNKFDTAKKYTDLMIRPILKIEEPIGDHANFQDMGLDSLMMIELKNSLQALLGDRAQVSMNLVKDCNTLSQLATRIVEVAEGIEDIAPPTQDALSKLIRQDAQLPLHISPQGSACKPSEIRTVLVTGVSGNLGPYILREISKRSHIQKIYCLMRPTTKAAGLERLNNILKDKKLDSDIRLDIVECVSGNITESKFGLGDEEFAKLSQEVDAVVHLAAKSDHLDTYRIARGSNKADVRTVNVFGTLNVLEFACSYKPKLVFHASTGVAILKLDDDKTVSEDWPLIGDFDGMPNLGYAISKFVEDLLMAQAVKRGLPCKVFRFPYIGGDSIKGGNVSVLDNLLLLRFMAYLHLGIVPTVNWTYPLMIVPVDICAELSCQIFFDDKTGNEIYNVFNPHTNNDEDFVDIAWHFGYLVRVVEPKIFLRRIMEVKEGDILYTLKRYREDEAGWKYLKENVGWMSNPKGAFRSKKLLKFIPNYAERMETSLEILRRDLQFAKESGIFHTFGLK